MPRSLPPRHDGMTIATVCGQDLEAFFRESLRLCERMAGFVSDQAVNRITKRGDRSADRAQVGSASSRAQATRVSGAPESVAVVQVTVISARSE